MNNKQDFSKVTIGQKLWSIQLGECEVTRIDGGNVMVRNFLSEKCAYSYEQDGRRNIDHEHQSLFFSNPNIVAPPPPERKIEISEKDFIHVFNEMAWIGTVCSLHDKNTKLHTLMEKLGF